MEVWKDVAGYEGLYQVSNFGRVKSLNYARQGASRIIRQRQRANLYMNVDLHKNGHADTRFVHRLVASAFVKNPCPDIYNDVNHIDGDKTNNVASNLEWTNRRGNMLHCKEVLHKQAGLKPTSVICVETKEIFKSQADACRAYAIPKTTMNGHLRGRLSHARGTHWAYANCTGEGRPLIQ